MASAQNLRQVHFGRERLQPGHDMPRHRHLDAYALVVVSGAFEQVSYAGRVRVGAGKTLIQPTLDCHENRMLSQGLDVLRLPWPREQGLGGVCALEDPDAIVRLAERDPGEAAYELSRQARSIRAHDRPLDWPDLLARDLAQGRAHSLQRWADANGLARETVARGFRRAYGVSPSRFRLELRARHAWLQALSGEQTLATVAAEAGYADQAHMTRDIVALTGLAPGAWRKRLVKTGHLLLDRRPRADDQDAATGSGKRSGR